MDPSIIGPASVAIALGGPAVAAAIAIIPNATAMAAVGTEKPEILSRLIITIVLGEALAIYGLLISFIILGKLPAISLSADLANIALAASLTMAVTTIASGLGISYCGTGLIAAVAERQEIYTQLVIGVVLSEALAIYGLLISFMMIGQI
jgi:V-type H+-transporting ATPase 21kDa proteolipid subunit